MITILLDLFLYLRSISQFLSFFLSHHFWKPRRSYFKQRVKQRSTDSSLSDAWFQTFPVFVFLSRWEFWSNEGKRQSSPGSPCFTVPQLFYPLVFAVLHFPQMRAHSLDIGWHLRCLESKDYVRLFLGVS